MTNDELTPEEREALANLPRERSPRAGLEDRIVAALREKGHLSRKPAKVIRLTTSRMAGLLVACLVLMIGAYSIGLQRGAGTEALRNVAPERSNLSTEIRQQEIGQPPALKERADEVENQAALNTDVDKHFEEMKAPAFEPRLNVPQLAKSKNSKKETTRETDEVNQAMTESFSEQLASGATQPAPATDLAAPSSPPMPAQLRARSVARDAPAEHWRTFALNSGTLIVDAPDSVRVETDERGRTLLIYTSNGVIRVRLAD